MGANRTLSPESAAGSEAPNPNKRIINDYCLVPSVGRPVAVKGTRGFYFPPSPQCHVTDGAQTSDEPLRRWECHAGCRLAALHRAPATVHRPPCVLSSSIMNRTHSHTEPPNFNRAVLFLREITDRGLPVISRCPVRSHPAGLGQRARFERRWTQYRRLEASGGAKRESGAYRGGGGHAVRDGGRPSGSRHRIPVTRQDFLKETPSTEGIPIYSHRVKCAGLKPQLPPQPFKVKAQQRHPLNPTPGL